MKTFVCQYCGREGSQVPDDATDMTCFKCDQEVAKGYSISPRPIPASRSELEEDEKDIREEKEHGWSR